MILKDKLKQEEYNFLKEDRFKDNIMLLTTGGSHAYGTNIETEHHVSDFDLRGIYLNSPKEILTMKCKQKPFEDKETDTVIYPLKQMVELLSNSNPNVIEILGTKDEHIFKISEEGIMLRNNADLFLSQRASSSFGGYAISQLRRNGKYSYEQIFELTDELQTRFKYAEKNSPLPKDVDRDKINELVVEINKKVLYGR